MITCPRCQAANPTSARSCERCHAEFDGQQSAFLPPGTVLNQRYRIARVIASGGMSVVYEAYAQNLGDLRCVVKALNDKQLSEDDRNGAIYQFQREAAILARLDHPNLPRVIDHFVEQGEYYLVMDFVPGESLDEYLERTGRKPLPLSQVSKWMVELCEVLDYLHQQSPPIIFRDLKPGNVMITPECQVKLIDFGIARFFVPGKRKDTQAYGTQGYSAPEQYGDGQTDERSDIYSMGVILHELLTGHDPTTTPFQLPPTRRYTSRLPEGIIRVIEKATRTNPAMRYQRAADLKAALLSTRPRSLDEKPVRITPPGLSSGMVTPEKTSIRQLDGRSRSTRSKNSENSCWIWSTCILVIIMLCACCSFTIWMLIYAAQFVEISGQRVWA